MAALDTVDLDKLVDYKAEYTALIRNYKITGDNLVGLCPFHEDRKSSFSVDLRTGKWNCFSEGRGGNFVSFWAEYYKIDTKEAYKAILEKYHAAADPQRDKAKKNDLESYNLEQYSFEKRLPMDFLKDICKVSTGKKRDGQT